MPHVPSRRSLVARRRSVWPRSSVAPSPVASCSTPTPTSRAASQLIGNDALASLFQGKIVIGNVEELRLGAWGTCTSRRSRFRSRRASRAPREGRVRADRSPEARHVAREERLTGARVRGGASRRGRCPGRRRREGRPRHRARVLPAAQRHAGEAEPKPASGESVTPGDPEARSDTRGCTATVPPELDADADDVHARVFISLNRLTSRSTRRGYPVRAPRGPGQSADLHGVATGGMTVPLSASARALTASEGGVAGSNDRRRVTMHWDLAGDVAGIPVTARLGIDGDVLDASADIHDRRSGCGASRVPARPDLATARASHEGARQRSPRWASP